MASNPFDQFDEPKASSGGNPFDQFDTPVSTQSKAVAPQELTIGERLVSALPKGAKDWLSNPSIAGVNLGQGSAVNGLMMGAADPVAGAAQLVTGGQSSTINQAIDQKNAQYEQARAGLGRDGVDAARVVGNIASPSNLAISAIAPINAATTAGKVIQGARAGAIGGASAPVLNADNGYVGEKAVQAGSGAVLGGLLTPVASKVGDAITRKAATLSEPEIISRTDSVMRETVNRLNSEGVKLNLVDLDKLKNQVAQSLRSGIEVDAAALARKSDFEKLGMQPTLGQITRDGAQYSREKNLRGVAGVGEPLLQRFDSQAQRLQELIAGKSAGAADEFTAGQKFIQSLQGVDDGMNAKVNDAYAKAKDHLGRAAPMDSAKFSNDANDAINLEMLNDALPPQARSILNKITVGEISFDVNSSVMIDRRFSGMQRDLMASGNKEGALAVGKLRDALNKAPIADNVGEDAKLMFDQARGIAKNRFDTHKAIPALKAAVDGDIGAQDFVKRFLVNGKAEEVASLAKVMPVEAQAEAKRQLGAAMERAAFGQNVSGDKAFSQESFAKFINQSGMKQKLSAFFSPQEMQEIERISRVGAYMSSFPANSTVNTSNTAGAMMNLLSKIPGVPSSVNLVNTARNAVQNQSAVKSAMAAQPGQTPFKISPEQSEFLSRVLGYGMGGVAGSAGTGIGN